MTASDRQDSQIKPIKNIVRSEVLHLSVQEVTYKKYNYRLLSSCIKKLLDSTYDV